MNTETTLCYEDGHQPRVQTFAPPRPVLRDHGRLLYAGTAALLLILMFLGFQQFYLHGRAFPGRQLTPPIRTLLILHGVAMTVWMLLFLTQALSIAAGHRQLHVRLGGIGALLACAIVLLGLRVGIESARVNPPDLRLWGLTPKQFLVVPLSSILLFAAFVGAGVWHRRRPVVHRPMMLLAVLAVMPAATDRIEALTGLYRDTMWGMLFGPFFTMLALGAAFLAAGRLLTGMWDRWFTLGYAGLLVASAVTMQVAPTPAWERIASVLLH